MQERENLMANSSLADLLTNAHKMLTALTVNAAAVSARGADTVFLAAGKAKIERLQALDSEQEALKAALKLKTDEYDVGKADVKAWQSEAAKIVKLAYQNEQGKWVEFGLPAKR
jgi:hypothetical protein